MEKYGYCNKVLRINLSNNNIEIIKPGRKFYRNYFGGRNFALYYLLKELEPGTDPLGPNNILVFATSVITGAPVSGLGRHTIAAKSPLTGGFGEAQCGGHWGAELKFAGFDSVIIKGKSNKPVYILIDDNDIKILSAQEIWGKRISETVEVFNTVHKNIKACLIGPAGENLVRYACISENGHHFAGRCGLGAVMGSKKLKAILVKSSNRQINIYEPEKLTEINKWFIKSLKSHPALQLLHKLGTAKGVSAMSDLGYLPTYNFQDCSFKYAKELSGEEMEKKLGAGTRSCYKCAVSCKRVLEGKNDRFSVSKKVGGPEYESISTLGSLLGVDNIYDVAKSNELCNEYGLDTISTGVTIAWAIECFERGIINEKETCGIKLKWNDSNTYHKLIKSISLREDLGALLAEGSLRVSRQIGKGSSKYSMQVKGQELPGHEVRGKWGVALGYAVSPTGGDHLQAAHDVWFDKKGDYSDRLSYVDIEDLSPLGILDPIEKEDLSGQKIRLFQYCQFLWSYHDVLDMCIFPNVPEYRAFSLKQHVDIIKYITGWRTSLFELMKLGERGVTMARAFNIREGFNKNDDILPERFFEPIRSGTLKGHRIDKKKFEKGLRLYYEMMGWDEEGIPRKAKLEELNIGWVLEKDKKVK